MKETKYKTIKDLPSTVECWDEHETIPVNTVCNVKYWEVQTLYVTKINLYAMSIQRWQKNILKKSHK